LSAKPISRHGPWLLALLLAGCAAGPDYKRPPVNAPPGFRGPAGAGTNSLADLPWWRVFRDDTLQQLIRAALTNNYDLRIAVTRMEQARAVVQQNRSLFLPQLTYQAAVGASQNVLNNTPTFSGQSGSGWDLAANVSWEIDLWGRIRRLNESSRAQFLSTVEARRDVTISLIANVAQAYFQLLALDQELEIAGRSTNSFGQTLTIFDQRRKMGVASKLETASAEAALDTAAASVPELQRQIAVQENLISVLLGENPGPIARGRTLLQQELPPDVPPGLPSDLLQRRPDIRQAEQLLRSANAQIGVAKADFFPRINLTGLLGQASPELAWYTSGAGNAWSIAAGLTGPIFEGGLLVGQYRQAKAAWERARLQYQSAVLTAFQEVSNALISRDLLSRQRILQSHAVDAYKEAVQVANERYLAGRASYYEILQEQQQLYPAENALTQTQLNQLLSIVQLYRALGGGWDASAAKP
jgi:multidrug efflux system outer membrane protein